MHTIFNASLIICLNKKQKCQFSKVGHLCAWNYTIWFGKWEIQGNPTFRFSCWISAWVTACLICNCAKCSTQVREHSNMPYCEEKTASGQKLTWKGLTVQKKFILYTTSMIVYKKYKPVRKFFLEKSVFVLLLCICGRASQGPLPRVTTCPHSQPNQTLLWHLGTWGSSHLLPLHQCHNHHPGKKGQVMKSLNLLRRFPGQI